MSAGPSQTALRDEILHQVNERGEAKSICPSEVARAFGDGWQSLMSRVRDAAIALSREGAIDILRKGRPVTPEEVRGVIRLRLRRPPPDADPDADPVSRSE